MTRSYVHVRKRPRTSCGAVGTAGHRAKPAVRDTRTRCRCRRPAVSSRVHSSAIAGVVALPATPQRPVRPKNRGAPNMRRRGQYRTCVQAGRRTEPRERPARHKRASGACRPPANSPGQSSSRRGSRSLSKRRGEHRQHDQTRRGCYRPRGEARWAGGRAFAFILAGSQTGPSPSTGRRSPAASSPDACFPSTT